MAEPVLEITDLSLDFLTPRGPLQALREVSLTVPPETVVGVVGESGCGKSTVIAAVMRLLAENAVIRSGRILMEGQNVLEMTQRELRNMRGDRISMVFQDPMTSLNPVLTIGRQMIDIQYREDIDRAEKRKRAADMLSRVGIPDAADRLNSYPHHFSGGMRQRITIAMALLVNPALLIADEPTTALDATLEVQIIHLLKELQETLNCAILFVSHHLNVIAELCDSVVVMYAGVVVETGSVRDIFHRAAHPYTKALLECDPSVIKERTKELPTIPGEVPGLIGPLQGCIFADRCPEVMDRCRESVPPPFEAAGGHRAACFLLDKDTSP